VHGDFSAGDTILVRTDDGKHIAKAEANYSSCLLNFINDYDDENGNELQHQTGPIISDKNIAVLDQDNQQEYKESQAVKEEAV